MTVKKVSGCVKPSSAQAKVKKSSVNGVISKKKKVVGILTNPPVFYQNAIFFNLYKRVCECCSKQEQLILSNLLSYIYKNSSLAASSVGYSCDSDVFKIEISLNQVKPIESPLCSDLRALLNASRYFQVSVRAECDVVNIFIELFLSLASPANDTEK